MMDRSYLVGCSRCKSTLRKTRLKSSARCLRKHARTLRDICGGTALPEAPTKGYWVDLVGSD